MLIDCWFTTTRAPSLGAQPPVLPAIVLGTQPLAVVARMTRSAMLEVLGEDYIRTARAKGLAAWRVVIVHALRNALIPVVTVIGLQVGALLGGAILTETIFSWPGVGHWLVESIQRRDYPVLQGGTLLVATLVIIVNLGVDMTYGLLNPRIRPQVLMSVSTPPRARCRPPRRCPAVSACSGAASPRTAARCSGSASCRPVVLAIFADIIAPHSPIEQFRTAFLTPPVWQPGGSWISFSAPTMSAAICSRG